MQNILGKGDIQMNDREALERFKNTQGKYDEGQKLNERKGDAVGYISVAAIGLIMAVFNYTQGIVSYDIFAVVLLGEGLSNIYRYLKNRRRRDLVIALLCLAIGVFMLVMHIKRIVM